MTTTGPPGTNINSSQMPILPMSTTVTSSTSTIPPLPGELLGQFAMSVPPFASPRSQIQPPLFNHDKPPDNNSQSTLPSWNGGYVSDGESSLPSISRSSESGTYSEPREFRSHRRIASYPSMYKPEAPTPIEPQNYRPYHEDGEKSARDERVIFREQLSHNTSDDIMNMVYRSFQSCPSVMPDGSCCGNTNRNSNTAVSICRCGTGCKCQGCNTQVNNDGGYEVPSTYTDSRPMSSTGGCCSSTSSTIAQPQHTIILDEDQGEFV